MLILPDLNDIKLPDDPAQRKNVLNLHDKPDIKRNFLSLLQDVLLLPYGVTQDQSVPLGMSPYSFKRVIVNNWKAEDLENVSFRFLFYSALSFVRTCVCILKFRLRKALCV